MAMFKVLRNGNFARLWCAGLISQAGDWVLLIGLPISVGISTRSLLATSITFAAGIIRQIVLGSVAGVFVDRWNRRRTLVVANLLLAVALAPLVLVRTPDHVWIVYIVIFAETCFEQFTVPGAECPAARARHRGATGIRECAQRSQQQSLAAGWPSVGWCYCRILRVEWHRRRGCDLVSAGGAGASGHPSVGRQGRLIRESHCGE